jgi:CTP:molybdopterin cytidylyltransferase MocA
MAGTAGLLLAAGAGRRFGGPKALVRFGDRYLVERGLSILLSGGCDPVHVVLGAGADEVQARARLHGGVVVPNPQWPTGLGSSLRTGLGSLPDTVDAVVVLLVDQPLVGPGAVHRLRAAQAAGAPVAVATYAGRTGHPVLLSRDTWADVIHVADGDRGASPFLRAHPELVTPVPCDGTGSPDDIDTPADLAALRARHRCG